MRTTSKWRHQLCKSSPMRRSHSVLSPTTPKAQKSQSRTPGMPQRLPGLPSDKTRYRPRSSKTSRTRMTSALLSSANGSSTDPRATQSSASRRRSQMFRTLMTSLRARRSQSVVVSTTRGAKVPSLPSSLFANSMQLSSALSPRTTKSSPRAW